VAGVMHRYWSHLYPEDFGAKPQDRPRLHKKTMDFAMRYVDGILADVLAFQDTNPDLIVVFATSMGQAAVHRDTHEGFEAAVSDLLRLFEILGIQPGSWKPLLAMVPQVAVDLTDSAKRRELKIKLEGCRSLSGASLFSVKEIGNSLSITIRTPRVADIQSGGFHGPTGRRHSWQDAGISMNAVEAGTGYHIPEGVMAIRTNAPDPRDKRTFIRADAVKALLMELAGLESGKDQLKVGSMDVGSESIR
jgi:hypothetical protein